MDIRFVRSDDAEAIREIYAPAITRTDVATSFEVEVPSVEEIRQRIADKTRTYPWLVGEEGGVVIGYVYADAHRSRAAYQWSADVSVYIHESHHRRGVGKKLYRALFEILKSQGIINVYAGIALPNPGSVGLHESLGFAPVGVYRAVGHKFGKAHDVGWWHLALAQWPDEPAPIISWADLRETP